MHQPTRGAAFLRGLIVLFVSLCTLTASAQEKIRVACVGDSITFGAGIKDRAHDSYPVQLGKILGNMWEVRNFGVSGRTLLTHGDYPWIREKQAQQAFDFDPHVVVIMLGTNDSKPQNWKHKDEFVADYEALVKRFQKGKSLTDIYLVLPVPAFPGNWGISDKIIHGEVIPMTEQVAKETGCKTIDLYTPMKEDGALFPDTVHPNPAGAKKMAELIAAAFRKPGAGGVRSVNTCLCPVTQHRDIATYNFDDRHAAILKLVHERPDTQLVFIGDSITHFWGGDPLDCARARPDRPVWEKHYGNRKALDLGYGWDRTENVLWRLQNGEFDGIAPKVAVVMIGTNNIGLNSPAEIAQGVTAICDAIHRHSAKTHILLLAVFPRGHRADDGARPIIADLNRRIAPLGKRPGITFLDIGAKFLAPDGTIDRAIMGDYLHPTPRGYEIWAEAIEPTLSKLLGE